MERSRDTYQAYTLRLARVSETGAWRSTLYCAITGQLWRFADLDQLCAFLHQAAIEPPPCPVLPEEPE